MPNLLTRPTFSAIRAAEKWLRIVRNQETLFAHGFVIEFANPKALLYFAVILPQFLDAGLPILPQLLIMGGTTLFIDLIAYSAYALIGDHPTRGGLKVWMVSLINKTAGVALLYAGSEW
ncbi:MAG: LysE family translocator [Rhodomicrobiaceae bacterium]